MPEKDKEFLKKILSTFRIEAGEHVSAISSGLIELEKAPADRQAEIIEIIFREAHSLKGASRAVNITEAESICQSLESLFAALKRNECVPTAELFDTLHQAVDLLGTVTSHGEPGKQGDYSGKMKLLLPQIDQYAAGGHTPSPFPSPVAAGIIQKTETRQAAAAERVASEQTIRVPSPKLDSILLEVEEMTSVRLTMRHLAAELQGIEERLVAWEKDRAKILPELQWLRRSAERTRREGLETGSSGEQNLRFERIVEFYERSDSFARSHRNALVQLRKSVEDDERLFSRMIDGLTEGVKKLVMMPWAGLLDIFPKFVRDLSRDQGKEAELAVQGGEIEVDKRILDEMKEPLLHMVRNSLDHGIEKPEERQRKKKRLLGKITLSISQKNGSKVEVVVSDDGAGMGVAQVKSAAVKAGVVSAEEIGNLTEDQILSLVFQSGVSTSPMITDLSGRGLGLAILQEKVQKLGGVISFQTQADVGTTFRIVLPVTLATSRGLLVREGDQLFVVPTTNVDRVVRVRKDEIKTLENRETIVVDRQAVSLVRLGEALGFPRRHPSAKAATSVGLLQAVVLGSGERRVAFQVDEILQEQEVLVKSLGKLLQRVRNVSGATVLPTGKVAPILNVPDLMKSAVRASALPAAAVPAEQVEAERKSILVVEDSITARTLVKNILESAGYEVKTAIDGIDAFTILRTEKFDVVVSDVDMPRMNGLDLTAKIRADKNLSDMPVILVTALESRADRERGIEVGANAYIVKSSFDQSNLIEVIRRLI